MRWIGGARRGRSLKKYNESPRHSKKVVVGDDDCYCDACDVSFRYKSDFAQHDTGKATSRGWLPSHSRYRILNTSGGWSVGTWVRA